MKLSLVALRDSMLTGLLGDAEQREHAALHVAAVDTQGPAAELGAVAGVPHRVAS